MRVSFFTPTHDPKFLPETYVSLQRQSVQDWEWVILPNGKFGPIPEVIRQDPRVRVIDRPSVGTNIGAIKRAAADAASGDILVELDHDDLLVPGKTIETLRDKFLQGAGFVYSDAAVFRYKPPLPHNLEFEPEYRPFAYDPQHGWQTYPVKVYGRELLASRCFDISPRSLSEIFFCPDHLRAWSRKAYYEAGGHNPKLFVCDDHELLIKTYLSGARFEHTGGCGYLYRMFEHNTVKYRNKQIQQTTQQLKRQYLQPLITEWLRRTGLKRIELTSLKRAGWSVDTHLLQGFGKNEVGQILAVNELQRFTGEQVREFMNGAYEALAPGGYLTIVVPDSRSAIAFADVEWKSQFSAASLSPYTNKIAANENGNIRCRFQQIDCAEVYPSDWHRTENHRYLRFDLLALKGQRTPGKQHI